MTKDEIYEKTFIKLEKMSADFHNNNKNIDLTLPSYMYDEIQLNSFLEKKFNTFLKKSHRSMYDIKIVNEKPIIIENEDYYGEGLKAGNKKYKKPYLINNDESDDSDESLSSAESESDDENINGRGNKKTYNEIIRI